MALSYSLARIPGVRYLQTLSRTRGWPYVVAWAHRVSGLLLVLYAWLHIITLSGLRSPELFERKMDFFATLMPGFVEWFLAVPVIFHSLNGGRLILYELFGTRNDVVLLKWVLNLCGLYLLLLALFMTLGNQSVSAILFWTYCSAVSVILASLTFTRLKRSGASLAWKLQRLSGAFLFFMIPAHMLFMHLDPTIGRDVDIIITRMDNAFIKLVDLALVVSLLYHAGYGLLGICRDYIESRAILRGCTIGIVSLMVLFGWVGIKLIILI